MYYSKLPPSVHTFTNVLLVDPMLATGGSVLMAIKVPNYGIACSCSIVWWRLTVFGWISIMCL